jgi:hypothetical protein
MLAAPCSLPTLLEGEVRFQISTADMAKEYVLFLARMRRFVPML